MIKKFFKNTMDIFFFSKGNYYFLFNQKTKEKLKFIRKILKFNIFKYVKY